MVNFLICLKNLYLPNETQEDGYRTIYEKDYLRSNASHVITNLFRDAKEIVVYGLGFNDLDFELSILWGYGLSRAYREMLSKEPAAILPENFDVDFSPKVIVIDPNHNSVASRIKYLTPQITIECIHPNDL